MIVIDGDHAEQAAFEDLCWVENLIAPDGIVVLDDYNESRWPGVTKALDRYRLDRKPGSNCSVLWRRAPTSGHPQARDAGDRIANELVRR